MKKVQVTNMTSLFNKDMLIYSLFDIKLQSPLRVIGIFYFIILFIVFGIPVFLLTWPPNVYSVFIGIGGPLGGAYLMSKPIWNGKSFMSFAKTQIKYFTRPKIFYDWKVRNKNNKYMVNSQIIVSRHDDYNKLYNLIKQEKER